MSDWGATEWGAIASAAAAIATAVAGLLALLAAKWTVEATNKAADANDKALKAQIAIQREELDALASDRSEATRREKLYAAYQIYTAAGFVIEDLRSMIAQGELFDQRPDKRIRAETTIRVEACYPVATLLSRTNHIHFQTMDAIVHSEPVTTVEQLRAIVDRLNELRQALTPAVVGLPKGSGSRIYGHDGEKPLVATNDAEL